MSEEVVSEIVEIDGIELEIIAEQSSDHEWMLAVRNPIGVLSVWNELFTSAELAIDAAHEAIEKEGLAPFMDMEGFEYLLH